MRGALAMAEAARRPGIGRLLLPLSARRRRPRSSRSSRSSGSRRCRRPSRCSRAGARRRRSRRARRSTSRPRRARPGRRPRPQRARPGARGRRGRRPQPLPARPARYGEDDARPAAPVAAAADDARRGDRGHPARTRSPASTTGGLVARRPFRAPHHTISASGLVGGGTPPTPGEATLAHHGVLFLDELSEFIRPALEALRQPLEDGRVTIVRAQRVMVFPTRITLVAASNPCGCGMGEERLPLHRGRPRPPPPAAQRAAARPHRRLRHGRAARRPTPCATRPAPPLGRRARADRRRPRAPDRPARRHRA